MKNNDASSQDSDQLSSTSVLIEEQLNSRKRAHAEAITVKEFEKQLQNAEIELLRFQQCNKEELNKPALDKLYDQLVYLGDIFTSEQQESICDILSKFESFTHMKDQCFPSILSMLAQLTELLNPDMEIDIKVQGMKAPEDARTAYKGVQLASQWLKVRLAYRRIYRGAKYRKVGLDEASNSHGDNPIQTLSKKNIERLISKLKKMDGDTSDRFGLRSDEGDFFYALLNLPYKLQHATNHFSSIARAGQLRSLTEVQHHDPEFKSEFSTPGNLSELGNDGFVFYRCYVEGRNGDQTRYGNTRIISDLQQLREIGWVSLHDQLVPFPQRNRQQTFRFEKRIIFQACPANINNKAQKNKNCDGIEYRYRTAAINNTISGNPDTIKVFKKELSGSKEIISFTEEIFYGEDILLGITLSVIYRLRKLEACGYRALQFNKFSSASNLERVILLGQLIKDFFRIEGKYPVAVPLQYDRENQACFFTPYAGSDCIQQPDRALKVENPEGDGRLNLDLSFNDTNAIIAFYKERLKAVSAQIDILQKRKDSNAIAALKAEKLEIEAFIKDKECKQVEFLEKIRSACPGVEMLWLEKRSYEFVELLARPIVFLVERKLMTEINVDNLQSFNLKRMGLLTQYMWGDLLTRGKVTWAEMLQLSDDELQDMLDADITSAVVEHDFTLTELVGYLRDDADKFKWATCDDVTDLALQYVPDIPDGFNEFVEEKVLGEIDWEWILAELDDCPSEKQQMELYLGLNDDPVDYNEDDEEYDEEYDEESNHHRSPGR